MKKFLSFLTVTLVLLTSAIFTSCDEESKEALSSLTGKNHWYSYSKSVSTETEDSTTTTSKLKYYIYYGTLSSEDASKLKDGITMEEGLTLFVVPEETDSQFAKDLAKAAGTAPNAFIYKNYPKNKNVSEDTESGETNFKINDTNWTVFYNYYSAKKELSKLDSIPSELLESTEDWALASENKSSYSWSLILSNLLVSAITNGTQK